MQRRSQMRTDVHSYTQINTHTGIHVHTYTHTHAHTYANTDTKKTHTNLPMYTNIYTLNWHENDTVGDVPIVLKALAVQYHGAVGVIVIDDGRCLA